VSYQSINQSSFVNVISQVNKRSNVAGCRNRQHKLPRCYKSISLNVNVVIESNALWQRVTVYNKKYASFNGVTPH